MPPGPPIEMPLGLQLARAAGIVKQSLERELAAAGGSVSTWQVLVLVRSKHWVAQAHIADAMGITAATMTHHLNALESQGLVRRWREADNRRVQSVELTAGGEALFAQLRGAARRHDRKLRSKLEDEEATMLTELLAKLAGPSAASVGDEPPTVAPRLEADA